MKEDELRPEYQREDFGTMEHGKHATRCKETSKVAVIDSNMDMFVSGSTETTRIGFINRKNQRCCGQRGTAGTDHGQFAYRMECLESNCGHVYGANGTDIFERKCPRCQAGKEGVPF